MNALDGCLKNGEATQPDERLDSNSTPKKKRFALVRQNLSSLEKQLASGLKGKRVLTER